MTATIKLALAEEALRIRGRFLDVSFAYPAVTAGAFVCEFLVQHELPFNAKPFMLITAHKFLWNFVLVGQMCILAKRPDCLQRSENNCVQLGR